MANENRNKMMKDFTGNNLLPKEWSFFQLVKMLEAYYLEHCTDYAKVGYSKSPQKELIKFKQFLSFAFQSSDISKIMVHDNDVEISVNFMGLMGSDGPMPLSFSEYVFNRSKHEHDTTLEDFLNIFHSRMIAFYYRAWADAQASLNSIKSPAGNFFKYFKSLLGINSFNSADYTFSEKILDKIKIYYSAHYINKQQTEDALKSVLSGCLSLPVKINQLCCRYLAIPESERYNLQKKNSGNRNHLGKNIVIGKRFPSVTNCIIIEVGPTDLHTYKSLLPNNPAYFILIELINSLLPCNISYELKMSLLSAEIPTLKLKNKDASLGRTTFLGNAKKYYSEKLFNYKYR